MQILVRACDKLAKHVGLKGCNDLFKPFMFYGKTNLCFTVLKTRKDGFRPMKHEESRLGVERTLKEEECNPEAWKRNGGLDYGLRYVMNMFFEDLHGFLQKFDFKSKQDIHWSFRRSI